MYTALLRQIPEVQQLPSPIHNSKPAKVASDSGSGLMGMCTGCNRGLDATNLPRLGLMHSARYSDDIPQSPAGACALP